jgi:hypothetical protein
LTHFRVRDPTKYDEIGDPYTGEVLEEDFLHVFNKVRRRVGVPGALLPVLNDSTLRARV